MLKILMYFKKFRRVENIVEYIEYFLYANLKGAK